jgi:hypothetical protein
VFSYETSPNERATVQALALRAGKTWTVVILDGSDMTTEKRSAAVNLVFGSLRPKGYQRESFAGKRAHPLDPARVAQLKEFLESSMKQLGVPGVGLALIDNNKIVFQGGLGVRELGKPEKVDENTVFMAASNTKGMTTLLLAKLVDQKKLRCRHDKESFGKALDLRMHRIAPSGSGMAVRVQECDAGIGTGAARNDAADQQVWRNFSVQQSHGGGRGVHRRASCLSG